jgi:hypothetical protein
MTNDELVLLSKGRIPAEAILGPVVTYLHQQDSDRDPCETGELVLLCERQNLEYGTIAKLVYRYNHPDNIDGPVRSLDFDTADKLLCGADLFDMWRGELIDYYYSVDLTWQKCACRGCETWFQSKHPSMLYCSKACRMSARHQRTGRTNRPVKVQRGADGMAKKCRNGHRRTRENTYYRSNGKRECLICKREANNESHARREQAKRDARKRTCEHPECEVVFAPVRTDQRFCSQVCRDGSRKFRVAQ